MILEKEMPLPANSSTLRILLIEDSQVDTESIIKRIQQEIPHIYYEQVNNGDDLQHLIRTKKWDLILSDFKLASFSVLDALEIIKEQSLDIPFIVISSPVQGVDIVKAMKAGVHDFIPRNNLIQLFSSIQDGIYQTGLIIAHKLFDKKLQDEKDISESANERKSRVLAFVAHEFRNPLNATLRFGELLEKEAVGPLTAKQKEYVQHMLTGCHHLKDLIDDILDIGPIETGQFKISIQNAPLQPILDAVRTLVQNSADQKGVKLVFEIQEGIDIVSTDPKRLRQILINLVSNAIKYTSKNDTVYLNVSKQDAQWINYQVIDHGPGIDANELKNLCSDYYRIKNSFSSQEEGLGLGLALTRKLVEAHKGVMTIDSTLGMGSVFSVNLPTYYPQNVDTCL